MITASTSASRMSANGSVHVRGPAGARGRCHDLGIDVAERGNGRSRATIDTRQMVGECDAASADEGDFQIRHLSEDETNDRMTNDD